MNDLQEHLTKFEHFDNIPFNLFKKTVNKTLEKYAPRIFANLTMVCGLVLTWCLANENIFIFF